MQVYAIDQKKPLSAAIAEKGTDYQCPECLGIVRLRRGRERQPHFFHHKTNSACRLCQKGIIHLTLQNYIKNLFPSAVMEKQFPQIGRIADVADQTNKVIFEIQYSPMSLEEAKERCADYESIGYRLIWILHDQTFNQKNVGAAERFLRTKTCYFSNMDGRGNGIVYDQLEEIRGKRRLSKSDPFGVFLGKFSPLPESKWPEELEPRSLTWPLYAEGDLFDLALKAKFVPSSKKGRGLLGQLKQAYFTCLYMLLERSSK